jgi:hypothetical protein
MLELLIALFLIGTCALPLAELPMRAVHEAIKTSYRMEMPRLADLAFAEIKGKLYRQEISWSDISSPSDNKAIVMGGDVTIAFEPFMTREFTRKGTLSSVGKKGKEGEEWRLVTFRIVFKPKEKKYKLFRVKTRKKSWVAFSYQILVGKTGLSVPPPIEPPKT